MSSGFPLPWTPAFAGERLRRRPHPNSPCMNQSGAAAAVAGQALAINPVAAASGVLDLVIIAQPRGRRLPPPLGRDPFRPFGAGDVMDSASPDEAPGHTLGSGVDDSNRFRTVEQA